jgi:hypothetical protein
MNAPLCWRSSCRAAVLCSDVTGVLLFCRCQVAHVRRIGHDSAVSIWLLLILSGAAVAVVLAALFIGRKRPPRLYELGAISDQWLSQERAHARDSER